MKTILVDAVDCFVVERPDGTFAINNDMQDLLDSYDSLKLILTNANPEQQIQFNLTNLPYPLFSLNQDPKKTDPSYYTRLLEEKGLSVDDVVYFEHSSEACDSAKSVGINTYFYDHAIADLEALKTFLDEAIK